MMCWHPFSHACVETQLGEMIYWLEWGEYKKNNLYSRMGSLIWFTTWDHCKGQSRVKVEWGSLNSSTTEGVNGYFCRKDSSLGFYWCERFKHTFRDLHWQYIVPVTKPKPVRFYSGRQNWKQLQAANQTEYLAFKFLDRHTIMQLKNLCITLYLLRILICSFQRVGKLDNVSFIQKFLFSWNIACLQTAQHSSAEWLCLPSHKDDSMHFTNSKQSWYVQTHKGIDYSGWQHETLSLEMKLAGGQEIRSRVALCILIHVSESVLKPIESQRVCSLPWHPVCWHVAQLHVGQHIRCSDSGFPGSLSWFWVLNSF